MDSNVSRLKLSEDLLIDIFLRASVESLVRAKCVCKNWYSLLKSPKFTLNHLRYHKTNNKGRLLLQYFKEETHEYTYALFDDENLVSTVYHDLDRFQLNQNDFHMEGPINGLYCLFNNNDRVVLWNPALKEFRTLPLPHPHFLPNISVHVGNIGFGINPLTHDYKLVFLRCFVNKREYAGCPAIYASMYNLSTNTWSLIHVGNVRTFKYDYQTSANSSFVNGIYYWRVYAGYITAFDMEKEVFRGISGPDVSHPWSIPGCLASYNDSLALLLLMYSSIDIWVMLEESIWMKQFSFISLPEGSFAVGVWKNDVFLIKTVSSEYTDKNQPCQMLLYDAATQEMRYVGPKAMGIKASVYCESLVSVDCGTEYKRKFKSLETASNFLDLLSNPYLVTDH